MWRCHPKHVEQYADVNKLYIVASCWTIIDTYCHKKYRRRVLQAADSNTDNTIANITDFKDLGFKYLYLN